MEGAEKRCNFWLPKKKRFCANVPLKHSPFCGNHKPESEEVRIPCPIDPSHSILQENLDAHVKRCPMKKQVHELQMQPFFKKGVNSGNDDEVEGVSSISAEAKITCFKSCSESSDLTSEMKRNAIYQMSVPEFSGLLKKIRSIHSSIFSNIKDSYAMPEACDRWLKKEVDRQLPFQEKHVLQQASILGNLEAFGVIRSSCDLNDQEADKPLCCGDSSGCNIQSPAVIEFGAGRGYLTQMLTDCYGIQKVFLVERKSYKLKADRSLRQKKQIILERLRIDIEDLNLDAIESLRGVPYLAIGKHLCGPATDLTLRCCLSKQCSENGIHSSVNCNLKGLALATCCHHLCQWKHYINKRFFSDQEISKEDFHAITWLTSWAVDADHGSILSDVVNQGLHNHNLDPTLLWILHWNTNGSVKGKYLPHMLQENMNLENRDSDAGVTGVEEIVRNMKALDRAVLGLICKEVIDIGRLMWIKEHGLEAQLLNYVPSKISPENHLLVAKGPSDI